MTLKNLLLNIGARIRLPPPNLDQIVRPTGDKPPIRNLCSGRHHTRMSRRRRPAHRIHTRSMSHKRNLIPRPIILNLINAHSAIGASAGEQAPKLMGRPLDRVDGRSVVREFSEPVPGASSLLPDNHLAVVARRGENVAEFGVGPGNLPYGAVMAVYRRRWLGGAWPRGDGRTLLMCQ